MKTGLVRIGPSEGTGRSCRGTGMAGGPQAAMSGRHPRPQHSMPWPLPGLVNSVDGKKEAEREGQYWPSCRTGQRRGMEMAVWQSQTESSCPADH